MAYARAEQAREADEHSSVKRQLLLGCGHNKAKLIHFPEIGDQWTNLTTLDMSADCRPDVLWNLDNLPLPFEADSFDEIHAYEVLEHCGRQGDWKFFFAQFSEFWRILTPGGYFVGSCPMWDNVWAWADPGHTRLISPQSLVFLSQLEYKAQVGKTHMTDYRSVYQADFETVAVKEDQSSWGFVLRAVKPSRL